MKIILTLLNILTLLIISSCNIELQKTKITDSSEEEVPRIEAPHIDSAPTVNNITTHTRRSQTETFITLNYTDIDTDLATSCSVSNLSNLTVTTICACNGDGICKVGVTGSIGYTGAVSFNYTVTTNSLTSNIATANFNLDVLFATEWKTDNTGTSANNQITLPLVSGGNYNFLVDWGDGSTHTITSWNDANKTHTYSTPGIYTVTIDGVFDRMAFNNGGDAQKILEVVSWGNNTWATMEGAFYGASNLQITASNSPDLSLVTNLSSMFRGASNFNSNIGTWNITAATDLSYMFCGASAFNQDISSWSTGNVTNMSHMFCNTSTFNQDLSSWNITSVTDMSGMFKDATAFNQDLSGWDISNVTSYIDFSNGASSWTQPKPPFFYDTAPVASNLSLTTRQKDAEFIVKLNYEDYDKHVATSCNITNLVNLSVTTPCACSIGGCYVGLTGSSGYTGTASMDYTVTANTLTSNTASATFDLKQLSFITRWDTTQTGYTASDSIILPLVGTFDVNVDWGDGSAIQRITNTDGEAGLIHQYSVSGIYTVTISGTYSRIVSFGTNKDPLKLIEIIEWGSNKWSSMQQAFQNCKNLKITATSVPDLSNVTSFYQMFKDATSFEGDLSQWVTSSVTNMGYAFEGAQLFNGDISNWDVSNVSSMPGTFRSAKAFNQDIGRWSVSKVTSMYAMFYEAIIFNQDISTWDTALVNDMRYMFNTAKAFNQNIGNWNTSLVTKMSYMFRFASVFNQDISRWDTSKVTEMNYMFQYAVDINQDLSVWDVGLVTGYTGFDANASSWTLPRPNFLP